MLARLTASGMVHKQWSLNHGNSTLGIVDQCAATPVRASVEIGRRILPEQQVEVEDVPVLVNTGLAALSGQSER
jgi:hypothetical protein